MKTNCQHVKGTNQKQTIVNGVTIIIEYCVDCGEEIGRKVSEPHRVDEPRS